MDDELANRLEARLDALLRAEREGGLPAQGRSQMRVIRSVLAGKPPQGAPLAVLMAGLPGAGKTTLARALEQDGYQRLCPDEEMFRRYGHYGKDFPRGQFRVREAPVLDDIAAEFQELLTAGRNVVVDHGFWTPEERAQWATRAKNAGGAPILIYLPVPHEVRWERIRERNTHALIDANSIEFSEADLLRFAGRFHPPAPDEPHVTYDGEPARVLAFLNSEAAVHWRLHQDDQPDLGAP